MRQIDRNLWQRLWYAFLSCPVRGLLCHVSHSLPLDTAPSQGIDGFFRGLQLGTVISCTAPTSLNRLSHHGFLVGVAAGAVFAGIWFGFTELARNWRIVDWVLDLGLFKALRVRDLVVEEDLWEAGWKEWETRRLQRAQAEQKGGLRTTEPENTGKKER